MFLQQLFNGLTLGATYSLVAVGFSLVYSVLELVNFAHGAFYVLSAYFLLLFFSNLGLNYGLSIVISIVITGILGAIMNRLILEPMRKKSNSGVSAMIATLGVGMMITNSILILFGSETKRVPDMLKLGKFYVGSAIVKWNQMLIAILAIVIMIILSIIVYKTKIGSAMRAISQNTRAAQLMGVNTNFVVTVAFFTGVMCAAIAGIMVAIYYGTVDTTMYLGVSMKTFASAVLGGIGSLPGAVCGGFIIGVLETFVTGYISVEYRDLVAFLVLIIVLLIKPSGLFGKKNVDKI